MQVTAISGSKHAVVGVWVNKITGDVLVIHNCPYNGIASLATEFGSPTRFTKEAFRRDGLAVILKSFTEYAERKKDALSDLESLPPEERQRFEQEHRHIHLTIYEESGLAIQPMNRSASGRTYGGTNRNAVFLRFPFSNQEFINALEQALKSAD